MGELGDEVIVYPVLHWSQDDHGSRVVDCKGGARGQVRRVL